VPLPKIVKLNKELGEIWDKDKAEAKRTGSIYLIFPARLLFPSFHKFFRNWLSIFAVGNDGSQNK
jgi:hypothetical protein